MVAGQIISSILGWIMAGAGYLALSRWVRGDGPAPGRRRYLTWPLRAVRRSLGRLAGLLVLRARRFRPATASGLASLLAGGHRLSRCQTVRRAVMASRPDRRASIRRSAAAGRPAAVRRLAAAGRSRIPLLRLGSLAPMVATVTAVMLATLSANGNAALAAAAAPGSVPPSAGTPGGSASLPADPAAQGGPQALFDGLASQPTDWPQATLDELIAIERGLAARTGASIATAEAANDRLQQLRDAVNLVSALRARRS